jgi:hypothetical protein
VDRTSPFDHDVGDEGLSKSLALLRRAALNGFADGGQGLNQILLGGRLRFGFDSLDQLVASVAKLGELCIEDLTERQAARLALIERTNRPLYRAYPLKEQRRQVSICPLDQR